MARVGKLVLELSIGDGALASARSVLDVLAASGSSLGRLVQLFPDFLHAEGPGRVAELRADAFDLLFAEAVNAPALGAGKIVLKPSDRYIEFVTAISRDGNVALDFDLHGWPILSVVACTTTVAEAGVAASGPGGGLAA